MVYGRQNQDRIVAHVRALETFKIGNVRAAWYPTALAVPVGRLPTDHRANLRADVDRPVYVVFSYATPIAWRYAGTGAWWAPPVRYTRTSAHHQSLAARGIERALR